MTDWNMWNDPRYSGQGNPWDTSWATWDGSQWPTPTAAPTAPTPPPAPMPAPPAAPVPSAPPTAADPSTTGAQPTFDQLNAKAIIDTYLQQYGLGELAPWAWQQILDGTTDPNQLTLQLYDPTTDPGKVVNRLYPEVQQRRAQGLPPMSIGDAVTYRDNAIQLMRTAGLPPSFYDQPDALAKFAGNDVSLAELKSRIDEASNAAFNAPVQDRAELQRLYGVDAGHLTAYFLDPDKALPLIQQQWQASQISGAGVRTGYGGLTQTEAGRLASDGVTANQAQQGLGQLAGMGQIFNPLPGQTGPGISRDQQLAAAFENNSDAQQAIDRAKQARLAVFGAGGQFAGSSKGVAGLGTANTV